MGKSLRLAKGMRSWTRPGERSRKRGIESANRPKNYCREIAAGLGYTYRLKQFHPLILRIMANTTNTPKHTDPETKRDEKKNEVEVKDKVSGTLPYYF